jgi:hypothetical protein
MNTVAESAFIEDVLEEIASTGVDVSRVAITRDDHGLTVHVDQSSYRRFLI